MRVAVTSTVVFDVPEGPDALPQVLNRFRRANERFAHHPMENSEGQRYVLRTLEHFTTTLRLESPAPAFCSHLWVAWYHPKARGGPGYQKTCTLCWTTEGGIVTIDDILAGRSDLGKLPRNPESW